MNRRPNAREGVVMPKFTLAAVGLLVGGFLLTTLGGQLSAPDAKPWMLAFAPAAVAGPWMLAAGALTSATSALLFWRVGPGLLFALPLWLGFAGVVAQRLDAPGGTGLWLFAAGALTALSIALVQINAALGAGIVTGGWLLFAGFLLRALPNDVAAHGYRWQTIAAGVLVLAGTLARVFMARSSSRGLLRRLGRAGRDTDGLASMWDVYRAASARVLRRKAAQLRPSLAEVSAWKRRTVAKSQLGVKVARVGLMGVWSSAQDHTLTFGGPRKGKTQLLLNWVVDAPGAVITTSTKLDVLSLTYRRRQERGPVWVFDPSGIVQPGSKIAEQLDADGVTYVRFNPLVGCEKAAVAMDRAADLIDGIGRSKGDGQGERWDGFAKQTLQSLLHAASLGGYTMYDVQQWVANPTDQAKRDVLYELRNAGPQAAGMTQEATQFFENNPNTQSSISTTIMPALSWLSVPSAAAAAAPGGQQFDVAQLLAETGTVYLIGAEDKKTSPLVTALTAQIARHARTISAAMPGGRLDPYLSMVLDEAALICLIPLDQWSGDFGSRGICMHIAAQSRAQLVDRFDAAATGALLTNTSTKIVFGGTGDAEDLQYWSTLAGEREEPAITRDRSTGSRSETTRRTQVFTPSQVAQLTAGQMLVTCNGMPPAIVKAPMYYKRWDVRRAKLARRIDARRTQAAQALRWLARRPAVAAAARGISAVVERTGEWMVGRFGWMLAPLSGDAHVAAGGHVVDTETPVPGGRRTAGLLARLEAADPVREAVAWLRLKRAARKARVAIAARSAQNTNQQEVQR
ncbi:type IV secretory system conjugative DNA transfer family protein [Kribbella sandramycini]|uniref:Type IV secretory pathway TraG/TraD family ATPase VirD4 n=1 Tax=Kribbella sandramycini TaxID=60450 RepID=A0A7Y4P3Q7_9ACTN|nr:type IV secretory system conjugative DNA transfer family protein [Kribbella sandramycini]MBB6571717.1 type IV secretory pathway TraG/TraD family ATPase VirD4 [Kribbella sandramycini]NOL44360.1 type IV secretory system conjugative DNA transfer family protein [Kribbella sandramycini]